MDVLSDKWKKRFLALSKEVASWSKDPSTKVGAYIIDMDGRPVSHGFNGFPRGVKDSPERLNNRELKYLYIAHAERNALDQATRFDLSDCILFCTHFPCADCAKSIIQKNIKTIVVDKENSHLRKSNFSKRHKNIIDVSKTMLDEAGINILVI